MPLLLLAPLSLLDHRLRSAMKSSFSSSSCSVCSLILSSVPSKVRPVEDEPRLMERRLGRVKVADELSARLVRLFLAGPDGTRPAMAGITPLDGAEPALLFHEYFHGDTGRGLGASHQTGWTSLVALLIAQSRAHHDPCGP